MAPGRRRGGAEPGRGGGGGEGSQRPHGGPTGAWWRAPGIPGRPVARALDRRPRASGHSAPRGKGRLEDRRRPLRPCAPPSRQAAQLGRAAAVARCPQKPRRSEPRSLLPGLRLLGRSWAQRLGAAFALQEAPGRRAPFCCAPGGSWLRHWARDTHDSAAAGGLAHGDRRRRRVRS